MLERIHFPKADGRADVFPFNIPALQGLAALAVATPVTLLVGENGSGKSTVLEALAAATGLPAVGSRSADQDPTLAPQRRLARAMRLSWKKRTHRGLFLRAEDFFGFTRRMARLRREFQEELVEVDERFRDHSKLARMLARAPAAGSIAAIERKYGADLDANSHGESFLRPARAGGRLRGDRSRKTSRAISSTPRSVFCDICGPDTSGYLATKLALACLLVYLEACVRG